MKNFKDIKIVDNFYQASAYFPMPTVLVSTVSENGQTNVGAYSLCFPYYIAGKDYYAMMLEARNSSNTAQNILRTKKATLNFLPENKEYFEETVKLGLPGETTEEKMKDCKFNLIDSELGKERPKLVNEAFQIFECSWDDSLENAFENKPGNLEGYDAPYKNFNGITSKFGAHFILKVDKILIEEKYFEGIEKGINPNVFPNMPINYGYRDSVNFWHTACEKPVASKIPQKEADVNSVLYATERLNTDIKFTKEACAQLTKIPRIFLKTALNNMVEIAEKENIKIIDEKNLAIIKTKIFKK